MIYSILLKIYFDVSMVRSLLSLFPETTDCRPYSDRCRSIKSVCTTSLGLVAGLALPDANHSALHRVFPAKAAEVFRVLTNFDLLDLLTQRGTITGAVLADNPDLLRTFRLQMTKGYTRSEHIGR